MMISFEVFRARCVLALLGVCLGCTGAGADDQAFTEEDLALIRSMALNPAATPPDDTGNDLLGGPMSDARATQLAVFGQQLFFDRGLSAPDAGKAVACADCHEPSHWFSDGRAENNVSNGVGWTGRNSPSLVNVGYYVSFGWDGRSEWLWAQGKHAYESGATMKGDPLRLAQQIARRYNDRYVEVFGQPLAGEFFVDGLDSSTKEDVYKNVLKAWGAYLLQLTSGNAPFDRFARGDDTALEPEQRRGLHLFIGKAGCISCHVGPHFTDNDFHSVGVDQSGPHVPAEDLGRFTGLLQLQKLPSTYRLGNTPAPTEAEKGRFRTKSLRHVAQTAPYFHAGQMASLPELVWFYNQGGQHAGAGEPSPLIVPLGLTESEQADLVAFLGSLTGTPVAHHWTCNTARDSDAGAGCP